MNARYRSRFAIRISQSRKSSVSRQTGSPTGRKVDVDGSARVGVDEHDLLELRPGAVGSGPVSGNPNETGVAGRLRPRRRHRGRRRRPGCRSGPWREAPQPTSIRCGRCARRRRRASVRVARSAGGLRDHVGSGAMRSAFGGAAPAGSRRGCHGTARVARARGRADVGPHVDRFVIRFVRGRRRCRQRVDTWQSGGRSGGQANDHDPHIVGEAPPGFRDCVRAIGRGRRDGDVEPGPRRRLPASQDRMCPMRL